jgi:hypothetical protein
VPNQIRGGTVQVQADGVVLEVKGDVEYNLGRPKYEPIMGPFGVVGWKQVAQVPFVELEITDSDETDLDALLTIKNATVTLDLANGKAAVFQNAIQVGEGTANTGEGNVKLRFEAKSAEEVPA